MNPNTHRADTVRAAGLAALLTGSGILHFLRPAGFVAIVPRRLPAKEALVAVSGAAELGCAVLLVPVRTRRIGGILTAGLFAAVFPANISMALRSDRRSRRYQVLAWARLPLQIPLIRWAWQVGARRSTSG
ncbi:hypothetical protein D1871_09060 [Nakamurella silvestris]|nr:hypothetical protein D1871_09060 [Nakamurella silvestris]